MDLHVNCLPVPSVWLICSTVQSNKLAYIAFASASLASMAYRNEILNKILKDQNNRSMQIIFKDTTYLS